MTARANIEKLTVTIVAESLIPLPAYRHKFEIYIHSFQILSVLQKNVIILSNEKIPKSAA